MFMNFSKVVKIILTQLRVMIIFLYSYGVQIAHARGGGGGGGGSSHKVRGSTPKSRTSYAPPLKFSEKGKPHCLTQSYQWYCTTIILYTSYEHPQCLDKSMKYQGGKYMKVTPAV